VNTDFITLREASPLLIAKVRYGTDDERRSWIRGVVDKAVLVAKSGSVPDAERYKLSYYTFQFLKLFASLTKHCGFAEEQEWRVIYIVERDTQGFLTDNFTYVIGRNGVEPKLRFPMKPLPFEDGASWTFEGIVDRIILGPTRANALALSAVARMFEKGPHPAFAKKLVGSTIPFRSSW
jgi:hypothetical protein